MMKIQEDPWDNYLYYDSKYVLPLLCHSTDLPKEKQALIAYFIGDAVANETISQYKVQGAQLVDSLIDFVTNDFAFDSLEGEDAVRESDL